LLATDHPKTAAVGVEERSSGTGRAGERLVIVGRHMTATIDLLELIDLERYPLDDLSGAVGRVLDGDGSPVVTLAMTPGTLLIFEGRYSLHRLSPIRGPRLRHVGLLVYETKPGTMGSDLLRMDRYGRTEPLAEPPAS